MASTKTDNASLASKVAIRQWLLAEMGLTRVSVLDTCTGAGHVWTAMRAHVEIERWIRCDIKPRQPGTLRLSAADAVTQFSLDKFNVIDIDPYGEPWDIYHIVLRKLRTPMAVFLTRGLVVSTSLAIPSHALRRVSHLPADWPIPLTPELVMYLDARMLSETWRHARILHAGMIDLGAAKYYALGLAPLASSSAKPTKS